MSLILKAIGVAVVSAMLLSVLSALLDRRLMTVTALIVVSLLLGSVMIGLHGLHESTR